MKPAEFRPDIEGLRAVAVVAVVLYGDSHAAMWQPAFQQAADRCPVIVGNTLVFRDDNHVTTEYAQLLTPAIGALADRALSGG